MVGVLGEYTLVPCNFCLVCALGSHSLSFSVLNTMLWAALLIRKIIAASRRSLCFAKEIIKLH